LDRARLEPVLVDCYRASGEVIVLDVANTGTTEVLTESPASSDRVRGRRVRLVLVLVIGLGLGAPLLLALAWFRFAGGRFGWLLTAGAFAAFGALLGWLAVSKQWARARRRTIAALAIFGATIGVVLAHFAPPTASRLRDAITDVAQPEWRLVKDSESGNAACFDYCTAVTREYAVEGDLGVVSSEVENALEDLQCPPPDVGSVRVRWECRRGDDIQVTVELDNGPSSTVVYVTATSG